LKLGIIGTGKLGSILAEAFSKKKSISLICYDKNSSSLGTQKKIVMTDSLEKLVQGSEVLLVAVKPAHFEGLANQLKPLVRAQHKLISVMAGVTSDQIKERLTPMSSVLRAMPNVGAGFGLSMTALMSETDDQELLKLSHSLFSLIGEVYEIPEKHFDLFTALCASGPAFVFEFIRSLGFAAAKLGFSKDLSEQLAIELVRSVSILLEESNESPEKWISQVATPGGCTEAGLQALESQAFSQVVFECIKSTRDKSRELSLPAPRPSE